MLDVHSLRSRLWADIFALSKRRTSSEIVGIPARGQPGNGASPEELWWPVVFPLVMDLIFLLVTRHIVSSENLEVAASVQRL